MNIRIQLDKVNIGKIIATIVPRSADKEILSQLDFSLRVLLTHKSMRALTTKLSIKTYSIYISIPVIYEKYTHIPKKNFGIKKEKSVKTNKYGRI